MTWNVVAVYGCVPQSRKQRDGTITQQLQWSGRLSLPSLPCKPASRTLRSYEPNQDAAIAAGAVFLALAVVLFFTNLKFPPHRFMHILVLAALGGEPADCRGKGARLCGAGGTHILHRRQAGQLPPATSGGAAKLQRSPVKT